MIKLVSQSLHGVPLVMVPGLLLFGIASALDLAFHLAPFGWGEAMEGFLGGEGYLAHVGLLAGMILTVLGLIAWGAVAPRERRARRSSHVRSLE